MALLRLSLTTAALLGACCSAATSFGPGNVLVSRVGSTGGGALTINTAPVYLDEFTPAGGLVQSVAMPIAPVSGGSVPNALTLPGQNPLLCQSIYAVGMPGTAGLLSRSQNGLFVSLTGLAVTPGAPFNASTTYYWSVARVAYNATIDSVTALQQHHLGDTFFNAASQDGNEFWYAGSGTGSGPSSYGIGYQAYGYYGAATSAVNAFQGIKYTDFNPFTGGLYASAQTPVLTGTSTAAAVTTDLYRATGGSPAGLPLVSVQGNWTALGLGASLHAPRGFTFVTATTLYVCDNGYGLRRFLNTTGVWAADPVVYLASASDANITQVRIRYCCGGRGRG